jgi:hypothetical protein
MTLKVFIFLLLQLIALKVNAMQIKKPEYFIKLDMYACPRFIDINGIVLEKDLKGLASTAEYPINHFIRKGENTISIHYAPDEYMKTTTNADSRCNISVWVRGTVSSKKVDFKVTDLDYVPDYNIPLNERYKNSMNDGNYKYANENPIKVTDTGDFTNSKVMQGETGEFANGVSRIYRSFEADVPFPEWSFFSAEKIFDHPLTSDKYKAMKSIIWPMVLELWDLFEDKKIDQILPLFEHRSHELDLAFYREPGYSIRSLEHSLKMVYKENYPLDRIDSGNMQLVVSYNEKLVTIINAADSSGTVLFYDKELDTNTFYDVVWMKKDGKWIISR